MTKITVCIGSSCHLKGSRQLIQKLQALIAEHNLDASVELGGAFCMGKCGNVGINIKINDKHHSVKLEDFDEFFQDEILNKI